MVVSFTKRVGVLGRVHTFVFSYEIWREFDLLRDVDAQVQCRELPFTRYDLAGFTYKLAQIFAWKTNLVTRRIAA